MLMNLRMILWRSHDGSKWHGLLIHMLYFSRATSLSNRKDAITSIFFPMTHNEHYYSLRKKSFSGNSIRPANLPVKPSSDVLRYSTTDAGYRNDWATKVFSSSLTHDNNCIYKVLLCRLLSEKPLTSFSKDINLISTGIKTIRNNRRN